MSTQPNEALVRRYLEEVVNRVDPAAAEQLVAPDLVFHSPYTPQPTRDRDSFLGMLRAVHAAFPDFHLVEHDLFGSGDRVATRWTVYGHHQGELAGVPPTGRRFAISGISIYRVANGRIAEGWVQDDTMQLLASAAAAAAAP